MLNFPKKKISECFLEVCKSRHRDFNDFNEDFPTNVSPAKNARKA